MYTKKYRTKHRSAEALAHGCKLRRGVCPWDEFFASQITCLDHHFAPVEVKRAVLCHGKRRDLYLVREEGMRAAMQKGKPVMLDFTGFGCVNCRKMEIAVWTDPTVADKLNKDYVLISLFVDDKTPLDQPVEVEYNGKKRTLRTIGDKWSYLEEMKFGYLTQPLYVLVDNDGNPLARSFSYKEDVDDYLKFLGEGLNQYKKR